MNYKQYTKLDNLNESLNSAKAKFDGTEEEFETLKELDPTANKKWKYMDFIVKVGYQEDLKELLQSFEQLSNKNLISNKDINSYTYESLKDEVESSTIKSKQTRGAIKTQGKKDIIIANQDPLVVIPLTKQASIEWGRNTTWCTSADDTVDKEVKNYFGDYFIGDDLILFYVIGKDKWAILLDGDGKLNSCWNTSNVHIDIDVITENTGLILEDFQKWFKDNKNKIQKLKYKSPYIIFQYMTNNRMHNIENILSIYGKEAVNIQDDDGKTPLYWACWNNNLEIVHMLLDYGAKETINIRTKKGTPPLLQPCWNNNIEMVKLLLNNGATENIDVMNNSRDYFYYYACWNNNLEMVKALLSGGIKRCINMKSGLDETPLWLACKNNNIEIVKLLLDNGAKKSINVKNYVSGFTSLYFAKRHENQEMIDLLIENGARE